MPDTVVTLKAVMEVIEEAASPVIDKATSAVLDAKVDYASAVTKPARRRAVVSFLIRLRSSTLQGQCRLKLWNPYGRDPQIIGQDGKVGGEAKDWEFSNGLDQRIALKGSQEDIAGSTLTWSVRLVATEPRLPYDLMVQVLQDDVILPGASFSYSGPLEDYEEVAGRFHFAVTPTGEASVPDRPIEAPSPEFAVRTTR